MSTAVPNRKAYTPQEAAEQIGLGEGRFRTLYQTGQIRVVRVGRRVLVPASEIDRFLGYETPTPRTHGENR